MEKIRVGSRESKLAVVQSEIIIDQIRQFYPDVQIELLTMKTTGDIILDKSLDKIGGKGLFIKELDKALMENRTDISVHSLKDMPVDISEELPVLAYSKREDPRDTLILPKGKDHFQENGVIGCSSLRRMIQLMSIYPKASFKPVRGNVITRLGKLDSGEYDALVLACAGLKRLGLEERMSRIFSEEEIIPAAGQGIIAVQGRRSGDYSYLTSVNHKESEAAAVCERAFLKEIDGGCSSPVAAFAKVNGSKIDLHALYYDEEEKVCRTGSSSGDIYAGESLGRSLARNLSQKKGR